MTGEAEDKGIISLNGQGSEIEESHKCYICGGPDHHGCGCEAKANERKLGREDSLKFLNPDEKDLTPTSMKEEQPALKVEPSAANIADELKKITEAGLKADMDAADEAFAQLIDSHEVQLTAARDIVEQLKVIAGYILILVNRKINGDQYANRN
jgi:hypothetical protein